MHFVARTPYLMPIPWAAAIFALLLCTISFSAKAGPDEDWNAILVFDKGPDREPKSREDALELAHSHFKRQLVALKAFMQAYPNDPRVFQARLRSAGILAATGKMDNNPRLVEKAMGELVQLEQDPNLPVQQRADVAFRRISLFMQGAQDNAAHLRPAITDTIENFVQRFPEDIRSARLLVELATLWDDQPSRKLEILERARHLTREEPLKMRIGDDVRRLSLLNKPLALSFTSIQGQKVNLQDYRGRVVMIIFWSVMSPQSITWVRDFHSSLARMGNLQFSILTVSLDDSADNVKKTLKILKIDWPTYFDGKGWESELARGWGINALPTVWMVDKSGVLRSVNARSNYESWVRKLTLSH